MLSYCISSYMVLYILFLAWSHVRFLQFFFCIRRTVSKRWASQLLSLAFTKTGPVRMFISFSVFLFIHVLSCCFLILLFFYLLLTLFSLISFIFVLPFHFFYFLV